MAPLTSSLAEWIPHKSLPCGHAVMRMCQRKQTSCENVEKPDFVATAKLGVNNSSSWIALDGDRTEMYHLCGKMERDELVEHMLFDCQEKNACFGSCVVGAYGVDGSCQGSSTDLWGRSRDQCCSIAELGEWLVP